jgi:hypothetical protein
MNLSSIYTQNAEEKNITPITDRVIITDSPSVALWVTIFLHSRELNFKFNSREWRNIVTHMGN